MLSCTAHVCFRGFHGQISKAIAAQCFSESGKCKSLLAPLPFLAVGLPPFGLPLQIAILKVLVSHPEGRATISGMNSDLSILNTRW